MKMATRIVMIWLICGLYNWGSMMAELNNQAVHDYPLLHETTRDHAGFVALYAFMGPLWSIPVLFITNFNQHGWELWEHKE